MFTIPRILCPIVRSLYPDDDVGIFLDRFGAKLWIHLVHALLEASVHAIGHDIQKSQHTYLGPINDFFFFLKKSFGPGRPSVDDCGYT